MNLYLASTADDIRIENRSNPSITDSELLVAEGVALMRKRAALKVYFQIAGESQNGKYTV